MDYQNCEYYQKAKANEDQFMSDYTKAKEMIIEGMRQMLPDPESKIVGLMMQIENAAEHYARLSAVSREARQCAIMQVKESREGHKTLITMPIHAMETKMRAEFDSMLQTLGLRINVAKMDVAKPQTPADTGSTSPADDYIKQSLDRI